MLFARVKLGRAPDPGMTRPAIAQAVLDVDGRPVRAQVAARQLDEAVDLLEERLRDQLEHAAAGPRLAEVRAPTLLIVGARDEVVLELNREARAQLRRRTALEIVPEATHLFEEPGALDRVAAMAAAWFSRHLRSARARRTGMAGTPRAGRPR